MTLLLESLLRLLVLSALLVAGCSGPAAPKFQGSDVTGSNFGRDFKLTDTSGAQRTLADFRGKVVVMFFGYTQCPDACPTTLSELAAVMTRVPQILRNVAVDGAMLNADAAFWSRVRDVDEELGDDGRVLVRPSGTEPLVRVMVESIDAAAAAEAADRLVELVEHAASRSAPARL